MDKTSVRFVRMVLYAVLFSIFVLMFKTFDASTGDDFLAPSRYSTVGMLFLTALIVFISVYLWFGRGKKKSHVSKKK